MKQAIFLDRQDVTIGIAADETAITNVFFEQTVAPTDYIVVETPLLLEAKKQLLEYFGNERKRFDLPLRAEGTPFQRTVWSELEKIPFGEIRTYGQLAAQIGQPTASRAVGLANGKNPLSIFLPCHRVIGANGKLTGYAGGLAMKKWLLQLEGFTVERQMCVGLTKKD